MFSDLNSNVYSVEVHSVDSFIQSNKSLLLWFSKICIMSRIAFNKKAHAINLTKITGDIYFCTLIRAVPLLHIQSNLYMFQFVLARSPNWIYFLQKCDQIIYKSPLCSFGVVVSGRFIKLHNIYFSIRLIDCNGLLEPAANYRPTEPFRMIHSVLFAFIITSS